MQPAGSWPINRWQRVHESRCAVFFSQTLKQTVEVTRKAPLKRHPALQVFSREHHEILMFCLKLRIGLRRELSAQRLLDYLDYFTTHYFHPHHTSEQLAIVPLLAATDPLLIQWRKMYEALQHSLELPQADHEWLAQLERSMEALIRFEERVLFESIQQQVPQEVLLSINGPEARDAQCLHWNDRFWE